MFIVKSMWRVLFQKCVMFELLPSQDITTAQPNVANKVFWGFFFLVDSKYVIFLVPYRSSLSLT